MDKRLQLQVVLEELLGSRNVYFQPPENVQMVYPCIIYDREFIDIKHANNRPYRHQKRWSVTVIDRRPESPITDKVSMLPRVSFSRTFKASNLYHDNFNLYY